MHLSRAYRHLGFCRGSFPVAEEAAATMLSLPIYPHITARQQEYVIGQLLAAMERP
jgi:dTDP-4-amino-4,6-dideoxygalactose transaminase